MKPRKASSKVKSPHSATRFLAKLRKSKKKTRVVFTNGCFDLLHVGHLRYLQQARTKGDFLIVALNADESVRKIKGPTRPINPLADRLEVMAGLECVDCVTWFEEDTPLQIIETLKPDVLVKGGDWEPEQIVGASQVQGWGGKVFSLPYVEGKSTTRIVERAQLGK